MTQRHLGVSSCTQAGRVRSEALLSAAVKHWEDAPVSDALVQQAIADADDLNAFIGAYRYYFYKANGVMALQMAQAVCDRLHRQAQWPTEWGALQPILLTHLEDEDVRLYISAYMATGFLHARLGQLEIAEAIAHQVQQLGAGEFGADVLLSILNAPQEEDD